MRIAMMIASAAMSAASGCATLPPPSDTNGCVAAREDTRPPCATDAQERVPSVAPTNVVPAKVVYPDVPADEFCIEDWADELAEKAEQGLHIRNGHVLVVVRISAMDGELQTLAKLRAKFRAIGFLRQHYPELPKEFTAPCRVLVSEQTDSGGECVVVMSFALRDIVQREK